MTANRSKSRFTKTLLILLGVLLACLLTLNANALYSAEALVHPADLSPTVDFGWLSKITNNSLNLIQEKFTTLIQIK